MSEYEIGRDLQDLRHRVEALEGGARGHRAKGRMERFAVAPGIDLRTKPIIWKPKKRRASPAVRKSVARLSSLIENGGASIDDVVLHPRAPDREPHLGCRRHRRILPFGGPVVHDSDGYRPEHWNHQRLGDIQREPDRVGQGRKPGRVLYGNQLAERPGRTAGQPINLPRQLRFCELPRQQTFQC